jgi:hypothetical protein
MLVGTSALRNARHSTKCTETYFYWATLSCHIVTEYALCEFEELWKHKYAFVRNISKSVVWDTVRDKCGNHIRLRWKVTKWILMMELVQVFLSPCSQVSTTMYLKLGHDHFFHLLPNLSFIDHPAILCLRSQLLTGGKGKALPVTGREGPYGWEMSRLQYFLDNRLNDGGEVVSLTRRPSFTPRKISGIHFC